MNTTSSQENKKQSPATPIPSSSTERYYFVDALRGIAALGVLFRHLFVGNMMRPELEHILPNVIQAILLYGTLGVQIFFVISGFVIAHSLRNTPMTMKDIGNFAIRRQLRLDPPYWTILLLIIGVAIMQSLAHKIALPNSFSLLNILSNMFYLQNILERPSLLDVSWTLCIEIQFYIVYIGLLSLGTWLSGKKTNVTQAGSGLPVYSLVALLLLGGLSFYLSHESSDMGPVWTSAWFIHYWMYFAGGVLCYWTVKNKVPVWVFGIYMLLFGANCIVHASPRMVGGVLTIAFIYFAGLQNKLSSWLKQRPFQYFGRISYSLYLVHVPILILVMRLGARATGHNPFMVLIWTVLVGVIAIGGAHLLNIAVERPSMNFASRLKKPNTSASPASIGEGEPEIVFPGSTIPS